MLGLCLLIGFFAQGYAQASQLTITATYKGSVTHTGGQFTNTTPPSGICADFPEQCSDGYFSVLFPWAGNAAKNIGTAEIPLAPPESLQDGSYVAFNAAPKAITVTNDRGIAQTLNFAIDSIGFRNAPPVTSPIFPYGRPKGDNCQGLINTSRTGKDVYAAWGARRPGFTECGVTPSWGGQFHGKFVLGYVSFRYVLTLAKPWTWAPGIYRGSATYRYGSGQDIYFGKHFLGNPDDVTIEFVLTVRPDMYIHFSGARGGIVDADLMPPGGWFNWQGRTPPSLAAEVSFDFGTLGPVAIHVQCQNPIGDACGIVDQAGGATLAVDTLLTDRLLKDDSGRQAIDSRLTTTARVFAPLNGRATGITPARLTFRTQPGVTKQLQVGHRYGGLVTIVFDSDVNSDAD